MTFIYYDKEIRCNAIASENITTEITGTAKNPDITSPDKLMKGYKAFSLM